MFGYNISPYFHEIMGIMIGGLFLAHIYLNKKETKVALKNIISKNKSFEKKLTGVSDAMLMISMPVSIITGIMISGVILQNVMVDNTYAIHYFSSYISLGIMLLHFSLHVDYFLTVLKRSIVGYNTKNVKKGVRNFAATAAILLTLYISVGNYFNNEAVIYLNDDEEEINDETYNSNISVNLEETPTLDEYLSNLYCTACPRNCSLLAPMCNKGVGQVAVAEVEYEETYEISE
jgi:hypothetical protein